MMSPQLAWEMFSVELVKGWGSSLFCLLVGAAVIWVVDGVAQRAKRGVYR